MPEPKQVADRDLPAAAVVDGDRALAGRTRPVEQHHGSAPLSDPAQLGRPAVDRGDEDAAHPLLLEHAQVPALLVVRLVGVAQDHGVARGLGVVLDAARDLGEERVGHVEHDQPETAAAAGPELAGGSVRDEAELLHRGLDTGPGERPDQVGMVQHVRDGADGHPGQARHVLHARSHQPLRTLTVHRLNPPSAFHRRRRGRITIRRRAAAGSLTPGPAAIRLRT